MEYFSVFKKPIFKLFFIRNPKFFQCI